MSRRPILLAAALLASAGCSSPIPQPSEAHVAAAAPRYPGTKLDELQEGRSLYVAKCAGCHQLVLPHAHPAGTWPALVSSMAERSAIDERQQARISAYLFAAASVAPQR